MSPWRKMMTLSYGPMWDEDYVKHADAVRCVYYSLDWPMDPEGPWADPNMPADKYSEAEIGPEEIDLAEVHDCFTVAEILSYEALGFAEAGQGARLLRNGDTEITGRIPVNTGGGLVGFGHPVGATGVKQALEIWRQSKGDCGPYQVPTLPTHGISANMGGDDRTAVVTIYRNHT